MNLMIGKWDKESLSIKKQLIQFMLSEMVGRQPQIGSIIYNKSCEDHPRFWEYSSAIRHTKPRNNNKILDVGGLNNLLGWYLYKKLSCNVTQIGVNDKDKFNLNKNLKKGEDIAGICDDIRNLQFVEIFDIVYCINVIEHIREIERDKNDDKYKMGRNSYWFTGTDSQREEESFQETCFVGAMCRALKPGGILCISYDYNDQLENKKLIWRRAVKGAYMRSPEDVAERIIDPAHRRGVYPISYNLNFDLHNDKNIHPRASTGMIILRKPT